jgi:hypothetical protein
MTYTVKEDGWESKPYQRKKLYQLRALWVAFSASFLCCIFCVTAAIEWNASHINIRNLCGNQFTYPKNIDVCNSWSHSNNFFTTVTELTGIPMFVLWLISGMFLLISWVDKKDF